MKKKLFALILALSVLLCGCAEILPPEPTVSGKGLTVQFIDVGQADCAILSCDGEYLLIDGGNRDDSQLVVSFLEQQGVQELSAVVCTHAHEDHVGGLPAVLAVYPTKAVYAPTKTYSSSVFDKFVYYTDQQGLEITIPAPGDQFTLGQAVVTVPLADQASCRMGWIVPRGGKLSPLAEHFIELLEQSVADSIRFTQELHRSLTQKL